MSHRLTTPLSVPVATRFILQMFAKNPFEIIAHQKQGKNITENNKI